jgi:exodeoxyribonuclease VII large subunit
MASDWPFDDGEAGDAPPQANIVEYTVSELSFALKRTVEETYSYVRVRGELGRVSRPGSGHVYLDLKDDKAVLNAVIWKGVAQRLRIQPQQGLEVVVTGKLTTFPGQSKYQIVIESMEPAGVGALMALLEERRKKLAAEGLFDQARKQLLPFLPRVIGVVTSPTGAVIRDILHRLADRFPTHVLVWPVRVQGESCGPEVAAAIRGLNALVPGGPVPRPDLIIVARGGGSLEDLWGFNDEDVVRAAAASDIPLISAVGHETDWTLIDHAADERAPTPTAAAERAVPVRAELMAAVDDLARRQARALWRLLDERKGALRAAARGLPRLADLLALPAQRLDACGQRLVQALKSGTGVHRARLDRLAARLSLRPIERQIVQCKQSIDVLGKRARRAVDRQVEIRASRFETQAKLLATLGYRSVLARGYALVHRADGAMIRAASETGPGLALAIEFHDGRVAAHVDDGAGPAAPRRAAPPSRPKTGGQGSLF